MKLELLLVLRVWWKTGSIINMTSTWYTALSNLNSCLLLLLHLLVYLLRVTLMAWNMHTFWVRTMRLDQNVLIWIRILAGKESSLSLTFASIFYHSLLRGRTLTFGNMTNGLEISNHIMKAVIVLQILRILLLLCYSLFKLKLLLHLELFVSKYRMFASLPILLDLLYLRLTHWLAFL